MIAQKQTDILHPGDAPQKGDPVRMPVDHIPQNREMILRAQRDLFQNRIKPSQIPVNIR